MDGSTWAALASILVALFSFAGVIWTQRAAKSIAERTAAATVTSSREAAEQDAYDRARRTLEATIDRQDEEIADQRRLIDTQRVELVRLRARVGDLEAENASIREDLAVAKRLLEPKYPDED